MSRDEHLCWFHGKLSRESAEALLEGKEEGTFLVRESNTAAGDFVLTLKHENEVCHYQIRRHGEDAFFSIDDKVKILHGLDTLVEFYQQAANGLVTKLTTHIKKDPPPNNSRSHGVTNLLHRAIKFDHGVVSELLKSGYRNVDAKDQDGQTALHLAAMHCDETILQLLLDAGVNVNCMDTLGCMPLHYACRSKSANFVRILIDANANVQGRNIKNGYVPLHEAAKHGNLNAVKELLAAHAPLLPRTSFGEFPIDLAKEEGHQELVTYLESYKLAASSTHKWQWYHGTLKREEAVEALLDYAAKLEKEYKTANEPATTDGEVPLESASENATNNNTTETLDTSGCFLVRYSDRSAFVLTLLWNKLVKNFLISQSSNYLYIDDGPYLPSLEHLVEHFMRFSDGLPVSLKYPVLPKPKPPLPQFSTMPRSHQKKSADAALVQQVPSNQTIMPALESTRKYSLDAGEKPHAHTLASSNKKKHKENSGSVFNTLRLPSPKKSIFINTLRKSKSKPKRCASNESEPNIEEDLKKTESVLKNLSFSTEFAALQSPTANQSYSEGVCSSAVPSSPPPPPPTQDSFYNVPKNNAAVPLGDMAGGAGINDQCESAAHQVEIESKTEAEVEYFTQSDMAIERERDRSMLDLEVQQQFRDWPNANDAVNANGYVPFVDIRVFLDNRALAQEQSRDTLEASAAELRAFSNNPERLDSIMSNASNESDIIRYLNRQNSNVSTATMCSEVASQLRLNYFIPRECLQLDDIIGSGEFGSVYKGSLTRTSGLEPELRCEVAIKTLRDEHCRKNKQEFLREASVMIRVQHHCIVQLIGISKGETLMMVQELVPLGSMLDYLHCGKANPNYELKLWASQIACGMEYLESHHFVHRDLAARNILLASRNQAKISDFGLSRALGSGNECYQATQGGKWPIKWYAPESFNNGLFSHASDVWSFGITLWEMFSLGEPPYGERTGVEAIALIEDGKRLEQPSLCPDHVYEIMKNCWNYKPKDRPTFRYLTDFFARDPDYQNLMELVKTDHIS